MGGHLEVVRLLCESGADSNVTRNGRKTPLWVASQMGHFEVIHYLREWDDFMSCSSASQLPSRGTTGCSSRSQLLSRGVASSSDDFMSCSSSQLPSRGATSSSTRSQLLSRGTAPLPKEMGMTLDMQLPAIEKK